MKRVVLTSFIFLLSSMGFAKSLASGFVGSYQLVDSKVEGDTFCWESIEIKEDGRNLSLYRGDISDQPMYSAVLNGEPRAVKGSHGEGLSSNRGEESVTLEKGVLTFSYQGINKFVGVSTTQQRDSYAFKFANDGRTLNGTYTSYEGVLGIGKRKIARCTYR